MTSVMKVSKYNIYLKPLTVISLEYILFIIVSLVMSEEALTIKRNITMIPHICGKEDP